MSHAVIQRRDGPPLVEPYLWRDTGEEGPRTALHYVARQVLGALYHYQQPRSRHVADVCAQFADLAETWRRETAHLSSTTQIAMHPAYQRIVGLGTPALPLIMAELERSGGQWFWALRAITGADPVRPDHRGRVREMAAAWLEWGRDQGLRW